jgi:hypothetical protein
MTGGGDAGALTRSGAGHPAPAETLVSLRLLWFGVFGAPFAWALQLIVDYAIVAHACFPDGVPLSRPVFGGARAVSLGVSAVCLAIAIAAILVARRSLRLTSRAAGDSRQQVLGTGQGRARFMAMAGLIVSILFTFAVLMAALPLLTRSACG